MFSKRPHVPRLVWIPAFVRKIIPECLLDLADHVLSCADRHRVCRYRRFDRHSTLPAIIGTMRASPARGFVYRHINQSPSSSILMTSSPMPARGLRRLSIWRIISKYSASLNSLFVMES